MSSDPAGSPTEGAPAPHRRVPALLVMHGDLADALLHAAAQVYGDVSDVRVLSNAGLSKQQLESAVAAEVGSWVEGGLLLTDFWGGSCHTCALSAARGHGRVLLLTGVNLPMLLDYLHNRDRVGVEELAERMTQRGRDNIRAQHGPER